MTIGSKTNTKFHIVVMLPFIKEAFAAVDYTNIVIPEAVYKPTIIHSNLFL